MPFFYFIRGTTKTTFQLSALIFLFGQRFIWQTLPLVLSLWALWRFRDYPDGSLIMAAITCIVGVAIRIAGERLAALIWKPSTTFGSARLASEAELRINNLFRGRGVILGRVGGNLLRFDRERHILTVAPTRSGKGTGGVIPNLIDHPGSAVNRPGIAGGCLV